MGFVPIFLTLGGFVLLFVMVVSQTMKAKKEQFAQAYHQLAKLLNNVPLRGSSGSSTGHYPLLDNPSTVELTQELRDIYRKSLAEAKLKRHQYNQFIKTKPYSFVAKIMGYSAI